MLYRLTVLFVLLIACSSPGGASNLNWEELNKEAISAMRKEQWDLAEKLFKQALVLCPPKKGRLTVNNNLSVLYEKTGKTEVGEIDYNLSNTAPSPSIKLPPTPPVIRKEHFTELEPLEPTAAIKVVSWCKSQWESEMAQKHGHLQIRQFSSGNAYHLGQNKIYVVFDCRTQTNDICSINMTLSKSETGNLTVTSSSFKIKAAYVEQQTQPERSRYSPPTRTATETNNIDKIKILEQQRAEAAIERSRQDEQRELERLHERQKQNSNSGYMNRYNH